MKNKDFVHIHVHTEFSLLDGGQKITSLIDKAKEMGQKAIATTDHGVMYGTVKAHQYAQKVGIKHIVGCELYTTPFGKLAHEKDFKKGERSSNHLIVLAKNKEGYKNLCQLASLGWSEGYYRRPRIDRQMLKKHKNGLIISSACMGGSIPSLILSGKIKEAEEELEFFADTFKEDFYIELQNHNIQEEIAVMEYMKDLSIKWGIPRIVGVDAHYLNKEDKAIHDALICIGTGQKVDGERRFQFQGDGYWLMNEREVLERFSDEEAIYNTGILADKIEDTVIEFGNLKLPYFNIERDKEEFENWKGESKWL